MDATREDPALDASYDDFLGKWIIEASSGSSIWTIAPGESGVSYTITGINNVSSLTGVGEVSAVGVFKDGKLVIPVQTIGNAFTSGSYQYQYYLSGVMANGYVTDNTEAKLATLAFMPDGTIDLRAGSDDDVFTQMYFLRWNLTSGSIGLATSVYTPLPNVLEEAPYIPTYEDYLGAWNVDRDGSNTDTWIISRNVDGSSYFISGIGGWGEKVVANYSSTNGEMYIVPQPNLFQTTDKTYGPLQVGIRGYYVNAEKKSGVNGSYQMSFRLTDEGSDQLAVSLPSLSLTSGAQVQIDGLQWYAVIMEGQYAGSSLTYTNPTSLLGKVLEKVPTDVVSYNKWIGSWNVGEDVWTVSADIEGYTYEVTGISGTSIPFAAQYDYESDSFVLSEQSGVATVSIDVSETEDPEYVEVDVALYGNILYQETVYYWGNGEKIAYASLSGNTATLTPLTPGTGAYGDFIGFTLYGVGEDGTYSLSEMFELPADVTAYSGGQPSSVKSARKAIKSAVRSAIPQKFVLTSRTETVKEFVTASPAKKAQKTAKLNVAL